MVDALEFSRVQGGQKQALPTGESQNWSLSLGTFPTARALRIEVQTPRHLAFRTLFVGLAPSPPRALRGCPPYLISPFPRPSHALREPPTPYPLPLPTTPTDRRDPNYYTDPRSIRSYRYRQSRAWQSCTSLAVVAYIAACFLGKPPFSADWDGMPALSALQEEMGQTWGLCLECGCVLFFAYDIYLLYRWVGGWASRRPGRRRRRRTVVAAGRGQE